MRKILKPLRVIIALLCFACVNAAFIAPMIAAALCADPPEGFKAICHFQLWPAFAAMNIPIVVAILIVTALFGRVYCSTVCPLGVFQDIVIRCRRLFTRKGFKYSDPWNKTRLTVFAVSAVAAIGGLLALPALIEPYSAYGRFVANAVRPILQLAINALADWCDAHDRYWVMGDELVISSFLSMFVSVTVVMAVAVLAAFKGRWFCNAVCPVGTFLSFISRKPLARLSIDGEACVGCGLCERTCKAECIDLKNRRIDNARCVRCFNCVSACRKGAIKQL